MSDFRSLSALSQSSSADSNEPLALYGSDPPGSDLQDLERPLPLPIPSSSSSSSEVGEIAEFEVSLPPEKVAELQDRKNHLWLFLAGFFVTNAIIAETSGGKLFTLGPFVLSVGILPWPIVFLGTDLVNEFYGRAAVTRLTFVTMGLITYTFLVLLLAMAVPAAASSDCHGWDENFTAAPAYHCTDLGCLCQPLCTSQNLSCGTDGCEGSCGLCNGSDVCVSGHCVANCLVSPVSSEQFSAVFGQSLWIQGGSLVAFLISQLLDIFVFWKIRERSGARFLWARSTGSTAVSQLIDTFVVSGIGFLLPGKISLLSWLKLSLTNYSFKLGVAILCTPFIYAGHKGVERYLGVS